MLVSKLEKHSFDRWTAQWVRNCLDGRTQRVVVNGSTPKRRPVMSGVLHGLELGPALFNSFAGDLDSGTECSLSKFTDNTNLCGAVNALPLQRDLDRLERWGHLNLMKFNNAKRKVLHVGEGNSKHQYRLGREGIESSPEKKHLGVLVEEKLDMTCQCARGSPENQLYSRLHQKQRGL